MCNINQMGEFWCFFSFGYLWREDILTGDILNQFYCNIFGNHAKFLLEGMKVQQHKGGNNLLLGDSTGGRATTLQPIRLQGVTLDCNCTPLYIHIQYG
jgi:hypothetical protein